ncbi:MAG TPA: universal stress protein [Bacteroidia bacterium]|nr:universal stress protein [Bacteroidia bacterium]
MKVKNILVPVDFSENSLNALRYAGEFARTSGAGLFVLHVADPEALVNEVKGNLSPEHLLSIVKKEDYLYGLRITTIMEKGSVSALVAAESKENNIDLVIMGTQGAGNLQRSLIGTHTTAVISRSECMVLAVPSQVKFAPIRKVVLAIDMEHRADHLIQDTINLFSKMEAAVLLVYVGSDEHHKQEHDLELMTEEMKRSTGYNKIDCTVIHSHHFRESIEQFSMDIDADAIAMITHHRNVFESLFDPSQAKKMAYHMNTPLLAIPQKHKTTFFF